MPYFICKSQFAVQCQTLGHSDMAVPYRMMGHDILFSSDFWQLAWTSSYVVMITKSKLNVQEGAMS